ncbi:MAG TPA: ribose 5-phosphate isomerase B [Bryobacteraceae bacterium]|nr:ribose 5-phosphate isomerase B [Bryobacteraceae bacterium]
MRIAIGADHAGFSLKEQLRDWLHSQGYEVEDLGCSSAESTDYPDYASAVAREVAGGQAERGILVCSTGVGMSITANKVAGVRVALGVNADEVRLSRAHNDANILTLGARYTDVATAEALIGIFLQTSFDGGRHQRRLSKIAEIEKEQQYSR